MCKSYLFLEEILRLTSTNPQLCVSLSRHWVILKYYAINLCDFNAWFKTVIDVN